MRKNKFSILIMICLAALFSCGEKNNEKASEEKAISVTVARVEPRDLSLKNRPRYSLQSRKRSRNCLLKRVAG